MGEAGVRSVYGDLAREAGELERAGRFYGEAIELGGLFGVPAQFKAMLYSSQGLLAEQAGDLRSAREAHGEAFRLVRDTYDGAALGLILIAIAGLAVREGHAGGAAVLLGAAARVRGIDDVVGYDHVRITDATTAALGPEEYSRCVERGRSMTREEIDALAGELSAAHSH
jgi:tetratricopeptide (TPR) repeat protein